MPYNIFMPQAVPTKKIKVTYKIDSEIRKLLAQFSTEHNFTETSIFETAVELFIKNYKSS